MRTNVARHLQTAPQNSALELPGSWNCPNYVTVERCPRDGRGERIRTSDLCNPIAAR